MGRLTVGLRFDDSKDEQVSFSIDIPQDKAELIKRTGRAVAIGTQAARQIITEINGLFQKEE